MRNYYKELVAKYMGRPSHTWKDYIKVDLKSCLRFCIGLKWLSSTESNGRMLWTRW